jgi:dipeptidyl aminopeptidase/acylaminoacyl peptidase
MTTRRPVVPEDLLAIQYLDGAVPSPDGKWIVATLRTIDADKDKYFKHLWLLSGDGGAPRRLTHGEQKNGGAVWSPDGKSIAFVSDRKDKRPQIYRLRLDGGEAERLTDLDGEISSLEWSPDGGKIAFTYRAFDAPEFGHLPDSVAAKKAAEAKKEGKDLPPPSFRHITRLAYKFDGYGFLPKARTQIHVLDVASGAVSALTSGDWDHESPTWSPDGKSIAFAANREADAEFTSYTVSDIFVVAASGGEPKNLTPGPGVAYAPSWSPDRAEDWWGVWNQHVWVVPVAGGTPRDLTPEHDRVAQDATIGDLHDLHGGGVPTWSRDGKTVYFTASDHGSTPLFSVSAAGGTPKKLTTKPCQVMLLARGRAAEPLTLVVNGFTNAGTVVRFDPASGAMTDLWEPNKDFFAGLDLAEPQEMWIDAPQGHRVQAWLMKPPAGAAGAGAKGGAGGTPMLLEIHGGPRAQYGATYMHEFQVFASLGIAVLFSNPRGSLGYGEKFTQAIVKDWAAPAHEDLMLAVDAALKANPDIDPARLGVTGGSYGGYMTTWVVGHTDRFKAALTQRCVTTVQTLLLSDDIGGSSSEEFGAEPWTFAPILWKQSPLAYVEQIKTPLMITHSMEDHRCNVAEAEMLYKSLKWLRREVEMVLYPGESHGLSRMGTPSRRVARLHVMRDWFVRHLRPANAPEATTEAGAYASAGASGRRSGRTA